VKAVAVVPGTNTRASKMGLELAASVTTPVTPPACAWTLAPGTSPRRSPVVSRTEVNRTEVIRKKCSLAITLGGRRRSTRLEACMLMSSSRRA
jgi:hypothetical protein